MRTTRLTRFGMVAALSLGLVAPFAAGAIADVMTPTTSHDGSGLTKVGPIADNGFPTWYKDSTGLRLEPCVTLDDPLCSALPDEVPDPAAPIVWPTNYPGEFFYQLAGAALTTTTGVEVGIGMDLEGAFANEVPREGDQMVFGRIRIRAREGIADGETWRVTHPYGMDLFEDITGADGINMTEDIGISPGVFGGALNSRVGPFLRWDPLSDAPEGYIGDPGVEHEVTGSPYGTNFVRVERLVPATATESERWEVIGETDLFSIQGRLARTAGLDVDQATYSVDSTGKGMVEVFARSEEGQSIQAPANDVLGYPSTTFKSHQDSYYGRMPLTGDLPDGGTTIAVVNAGDVPVTTRRVPLVDKVTVTRAAFDVDTGTLSVEARSSDQEEDDTLPVLSVRGIGDLTRLPSGDSATTPSAAAPSTGTFDGLPVPPMTVTVTSSMGGSVTVPVDTTGGAFQAAGPVAAFTAPALVQEGESVTLDASASSGMISSYTWRQVSPTEEDRQVLPDGSSAATVTFTAPAPGTYTFGLVVAGDGGTSAEVTRTVEVVSAGTAAETVAVEALDADRGRQVTLDASASTAATGFAWTQVSGPTVTLSDPGVAKPTFTFPTMAIPSAPTGDPGYVVDDTPVVLQVAAVGTDGVADPTPVTVTVTPTKDALSGVTARYRTRGEWRVEGITSIPAGQRIAVVLGPDATGPLVGTATADELGGFGYRGGGPAAGTLRRVTLVSESGGVVSSPVTVTR